MRTWKHENIRTWGSWPRCNGLKRHPHGLELYPHHVTWCVLHSVCTLLHTPFVYHVGDGFRTQKAPPRTRSVPPPHCGVYFAPCVLCSIHRSLWAQAVPPRTLEASPPRMRCVLSSVCTLLHIYALVTVVPRFPCSGFSNIVFSIQEYCIRKFRGLCIKGVSRVRSTEIPLSRI